MTAPWIRAQVRTLLAQQGHAWLLQGPSGLGQYPLGLALVQAWLCDRPTSDGACGACDSCHQVDVRAHTDLTVLMPETAMLDLGWPLGEKAQAEIDDKKRKPSREIRVDAMRDMLEFAQRTSGRGRGKAVLVYPAERMNNVTANTLLKTLEEPPGDVRFVLATEAAHELLPTIRSRCLAHPMAWPPTDQATAWLAEEGVPAAAAIVLLRAAGGRPEDALRLHQAGLDPRTWSQWPKALVRGDTAAFAQWGPAQLLESLQKLCHDLLAVHTGAAPRFFEAADLPAAGSVPALTAWWRSLSDAAKTVEHPFNPGLQLESLVARARTALNSSSYP
ncbi:MAG: holB [Ramlibacter sp.]|nr:holB [Ramlibacter sp.]